MRAVVGLPFGSHSNARARHMHTPRTPYFCDERHWKHAGGVFLTVQINSYNGVASFPN
jgi:hypothetical protein